MHHLLFPGSHPSTDVVVAMTKACDYSYGMMHTFTFQQLQTYEYT